jgi:hypothetical protein
MSNLGEFKLHRENYSLKQEGSGWTNVLVSGLCGCNTLAAHEGLFSSIHLFLSRKINTMALSYPWLHFFELCQVILNIENPKLSKEDLFEHIYYCKDYVRRLLAEFLRFFFKIMFFYMLYYFVDAIISSVLPWPRLCH